MIYTLIIVITSMSIFYFYKKYYKKKSAKEILEKAMEDAINSINTDEEIYTRMLICILTNSKDFNSPEEIESDLKKRNETLCEIEKKGFGDGLYKNLNDVEKKIYIIINGYDLELFPDYVINKAINLFDKKT